MEGESGRSLSNVTATRRRSGLGRQATRRHQGMQAVLRQFLGLTYPAMPMEGGLPNYFTINGKAYPATENVNLRVGQTVMLRFTGTNNNFVHPMHVHGGPFLVVARDGVTLAPSARFWADTVNVGPGQRYDVIWTARRPGRWLVHCHIPHHTASDNVEEQGGGGLMFYLNVSL